jgi:TonB family protein
MRRANRPILILIVLFSAVMLRAQEERWGPTEPRKIEEFKFSTQGYVKMLLDGYFTELNNDPAAEGHVIIYPKSESQRRSIEKIVTGQIRTRNFDRERITIVKGPINPDGIVQFWLVQPGADAPKPVLGEETAGKFEPGSEPAGRGNPYGTGVGTGSGDGTVKPVPGVGMAPGADRNPVLRDPIPPVVAPDQPLKIISKAPARYTARARQNGVEGRVELKITFLANGTIGSITVVRGLPDGLTDQAVNAARIIRFQPAIKNGVAVTTIKLLSYSFNIY